MQIKGGRKMRITTQMLANSAAKSGIPIQRTSLLDIINNKSSQNLLGTIGKSMNTTSTGATDILRKNNYAKLEDLSQVQICVYIHLPAMLVRLCCLYLQEI